MNRAWETVNLGDICRITSSKRIFAKEYRTSGVPFYRGKEIIEKHNGRKVSNELYISKERYEEIRNKFDVPKKGDILLSSVGTLGVAWLVDEDEFYFKDGNLTWIRCNEKMIPGFLYLWLNSPSARNQINAMCIGSTQKALTIETLKNFLVELPPIETQKRICRIIDPISNKIKTNNQINKNLLEQVLTLYRNKFVDTANNERAICRADEYFDISIGKTPPRKEPQWFSTNPQDVTWVSISDMGTCGLYISSSSEQLTKQAVERHNVKVVPDNTVLLSFKLTVGRIAITNGEMTTNEAIAHFKTDKKEINEYLYCYLKCFNYQTMGSTSSIATAVNSKIIKGMPFVVPTNDELEEFHGFAAPMFAKIKANQIETDNLTALRDTLLPKLMSGELDVSDIDI